MRLLAVELVRVKVNVPVFAPGSLAFASVAVTVTVGGTTTVSVATALVMEPAALVITSE